MIRFFLLRIVLPLVLFLIVRAVLSSVRRSFNSSEPVPSPKSDPQPAPAHTGGELKRDPVCGTFVSTETSHTRKVKGEVLYFCSQDCRDRYHAA